LVNIMLNLPEDFDWKSGEVHRALDHASHKGLTDVVEFLIREQGSMVMTNWARLCTLRAGEGTLLWQIC
jgi:hypothetical protein